MNIKRVKPRDRFSDEPWKYGTWIAADYSGRNGSYRRSPSAARHPDAGQTQSSRPGARAGRPTTQSGGSAPPEPAQQQTTTTSTSKAKCEFWLSNNAGAEKIQLPVLPQELKVTYNGQNESVKVAGLGETTIMQDRGATSWEFESIFPATWFQGCSTADLKAPTEYRDTILRWMQSKQPVKFTITSGNVSEFCTVEKFTCTEKGGDPETLYYSITLKEFRALNIRQISTQATVPQKEADSAKKPNPENDQPVKNEKKTYAKGKVKTNGSRLMLRAKATTSSSILAKMPNGSTMDIIEKSGNWYHVIYSGKTGYAYAQYVKKI